MSYNKLQANQAARKVKMSLEQQILDKLTRKDNWSQGNESLRTNDSPTFDYQIEPIKYPAQNDIENLRLIIADMTTNETPKCDGDQIDMSEETRAIMLADARNVLPKQIIKMYTD